MSTPDHARPRAPRPTTAVSLLLAVLTGLGLTLLGAVPAAAHDVLESSDPADGSSLATAPARVTLTFSESPKPDAATVTVVGPDGTRHEQGAATVVGDAVSVGVGPLAAAGRYEIGYRIVSSDGHPVSGSVSFTLTAPQGAAAGPAAPATSSAPAAPAAAGQTTAPAAAQPSPAAASGPDTGGGVPAWVFVLVAVVVVAGAVALVLRRRA